MTFYGVDQSLSSTGYCIKRGHNDYVYDNVKTSPQDFIGIRYSQIVNKVSKVADKHKVEAIAIEDYAYGAFSKQPRVASKLCELGGILKIALAEKATLFIVNTKYVKMWVGAAHNAKKQLVVKAINECYGKTFRMKDNDIADALVLSEIAEACHAKLYGTPCYDLTPTQAGIIESVLSQTDTVWRLYELG